RLLQPGDQLVRELRAERRRALRDHADLARIRRILVVLALSLARADPEDERHDDGDRDRDQPDEARERDEPGRRPHRRAAGPVASVPGVAAPGEPPASLRRLDRLRLVEEVELDVVVARGAHASATVLGAGWREERTLRRPTCRDPWRTPLSQSKGAG